MSHPPSQAATQTELRQARDVALQCSALAGTILNAARLKRDDEVREALRDLPEATENGKAIERAGLYRRNAHTAAWEAAQRVQQRTETALWLNGWTWDCLPRLGEADLRATILPELARLPDLAEGLPQEILAEYRDALDELEARGTPTSSLTREVRLKLWQGREWQRLEPLVKRLLAYMAGREAADLRDLCPVVWGKDAAHVSASARQTAICKANRFLSKRGSRQSLHKVSGELMLCWQ